MEKEKIKDLLIQEAQKIQDEDIKSRTIMLLDEAPEDFWKNPSSSSGKYHPSDEQGVGGLAIHTLRVVRIAWYLLEAHNPVQEVKDIILAACLLHDIRRYGPKTNPSHHSVNRHPDLAADLIQKRFDHSADEISGCVRTHMGRWSRGEKPQTFEEWLVHEADNIASKLDLIKDLPKF